MNLKDKYRNLERFNHLEPAFVAWVQTSKHEVGTFHGRVHRDNAQHAAMMEFNPEDFA